MIHFSCKWCGKRYRARERHAGKSDYCNQCGKPVWVPKLYLHFLCPTCGKKYRTSVKHAGERLPCRNCGNLVVAPSREKAEPAEKQLESAGVEAEFNPRSDLPLETAPQDADLAPFELLPDPNLPPMVDLFGDGHLPPPTIHPPLEVAAVPPPVVVEPPPLPMPPPVPVAVAMPFTMPPPVVPEPPPIMPVPVVAMPMAPPAMVESPPVVAEPPAMDLARFAEPETQEPEPAPPFAPLPVFAQAPPPKKEEGCPKCGATATVSFNSRSPLGALLMLGGTVGGLYTLTLAEHNWLYGLATAALFIVAVRGAFLKRWTLNCAECDYRIG